MDTFYMVFVDGGDSPKHQHLSEISADQEAERLARVTHKPAFVLKALRKIQCSDIIVTELRDENTPPF